MAYLQSNEGSPEEIADVVDDVLLDVSVNVSQSSEEHNRIRCVIVTRITPEAVSALIFYFLIMLSIYTDTYLFVLFCLFPLNNNVIFITCDQNTSHKLSLGSQHICEFLLTPHLFF